MLFTDACADLGSHSGRAKTRRSKCEREGVAAYRDFCLIRRSMTTDAMVTTGSALSRDSRRSSGDVLYIVRSFEILCHARVCSLHLDTVWRRTDGGALRKHTSCAAVPCFTEEARPLSDTKNRERISMQEQQALIRES